jgi:lysyl-tRNA synthetase class I
MPVVQRRLVMLDADESLRAIKWAKDHAEELEKFHRREGEYYAELPRSADDHAMAESYARMKRELTAIIEQNAKSAATGSERKDHE